MNEALCEQIREAFAGVRLGGGIGLREGQGLDDREDEATCARLRADDEKEDWSRIPAKELNRCSSSLSFFDAEGMRFHLPAYLIADLQGTGWWDISITLTSLTPHSIERFSLLSPMQREAVRAFLCFDNQKYWDGRHEETLRALSEHWTTASETTRTDTKA